MKTNHLTILEYMDSVCSTLKNEERYSAARLCSSVHNSFARFLEEGKASASVRCLDRALLKDYEQWLYSRNLADNTVSSYLRSLRSSYYRMAGEFHFYASHTLFKNVYTGVSSTCRRSVAKRSVGRVLSGGRLPDDTCLRFTSDMLSLQFLLCGMAYIDLYHLRKTNLQGNVLTYRRHKTDVEISLIVPADGMRLLRLYADTASGSPYLIAMDRRMDIPVKEGTTAAEQTYICYQLSLRKYNGDLHRLSEILGMGEKLSSYSPRHTWASIAFHSNAPVGAISRVLGHKSIRTTEFYLEPFGENEIDRVNNKIIRLVKDGVKILEIA